ncbi:hypothetical protein [Sphingomonas faeni]|uniref:hypothetical protein n=1 Tax=Sphingomonas faeni TaxID=185950 RepID=UPI0020C830D9|nr:hypothetical protein [Sphingomonas faeni]MCP8892274.1 hypothetical protein [Sphingomonas faeni]
MNIFEALQPDPPSRPMIVTGGVRVDLKIGGKRRSVIVTREALDFYLGSPPADVQRTSVERGWLGTVQHNMDKVREGAERKTAASDNEAEVILLGPGEIDLPKWR